jgi:hypothetical protein
MPRVPSSWLTDLTFFYKTAIVDGLFKKEKSEINQPIKEKEKIIIKLNKVKHNFLIYSFAAILLMELATLFLNTLENYKFYYLLFTQISSFILILNLSLYSKKLRFCVRKKLSLVVLCLYYLFNFFTILFNFHNFAYTGIVNIVIITTSIALFLSSFLIKK